MKFAFAFTAAILIGTSATLAMPAVGILKLKREELNADLPFYTKTTGVWAKREELDVDKLAAPTAGVLGWAKREADSGNVEV